MRTPGTASRYLLSVIWLPVGVLLIAVPVLLAWEGWSTLLHGHPSLLLVALGSIIAGVIAVGWAIGSLILGRKHDAAQRTYAGRRLTAEQFRRRNTWRITLAVPALILSLIAVGGLLWAKPMPAGPTAEAAMTSSDSVRVTDRLTWFEMVPATRDEHNDVVPPRGGFVFIPGARVDARAYAPILRSLAEAGTLVVVLKEPFGMAQPQSSHAEDVLKLHPEVPTWVMGGHARGGVAATEFAEAHPAEINGLALYGAAPEERLERADLPVVSISGSKDQVVTPAVVKERKANLPPKTQFVVITDATHDSFGDYVQPGGDGAAAAAKRKAQAQISKVTRQFLASIQKKK